MRSHRLGQHHAALYIVVVIGKGPGNRLAHRLQAGEVHHRPDRVPCEEHLERTAVAHVRLDKDHPPAGDALDAAHHARAAVGKVVQNHNLAAGGQQLNAGVRADVARAARYENRFIHRVLSIRCHNAIALCRVPCAAP